MSFKGSSTFKCRFTEINVVNLYQTKYICKMYVTTTYPSLTYHLGINVYSAQIGRPHDEGDFINLINLIIILLIVFY